MSKELVVSSTTHETRVAILEDDRLVEIYIERGAERALAGSVYKGRVNRVLPGMQSAFVKLGLERDAFLYVSDVADQTEEIESGAIDDEEDEIVAAPPLAGRPREARDDSDRSEQPAEPRPDQRSDGDDNSRSRGRRSRRRRGRGRDSRLPDSKFTSVEPGAEAKQDAPAEQDAAASPDRAAVEDTEPRAMDAVARDRQDAEGSNASRAENQDRSADEADDDFSVLPGESLAKYQPGDQGADELDNEEIVEAEPVEIDQAEDLETDSWEEAEEEEEVDDVEESDLNDVGYDESEESEAEEREEEDDHSDDLEDPEATSTEDDEEYAEEDAAGEDEDAEEASEDDREDVDPLAASSAEPGMPEAESTRIDREDDRGERNDPSRRGSRSRGGRGRRGRGRRSESESKPADAADAAQTPAAEVESAEAGVRSQDEARPLRRGRRGRGRRGRPDTERSGENGGGEQRREGNRQRNSDRADSAEGNEEGPRISDLLKGGQEIIVQIAKEPLGKKGARITSHVALPGRFLVYMPSVAHTGVSRKIASDAERARLRKVIRENSEGVPGGYIVRTAGQGATDEEIIADVEFLANLWKGIKEKADKRSAPALLHADLDIVERILRDHLGQSYKTIWVDSEDVYERIVAFVERFQPDLLDRVKLYTRSKPMFHEFGINAEIDKALAPKVWLKSGGYIVINQTEALVAIDVNTGKYVGKSHRLEDTIVKTNLEACEEIVRQMRLRDLGGIIVLDFIDMDDRANRRKVALALDKELRLDRAPSKTLAFNDFGLIAITRKRVKQSLERALCSPCPDCQGSGFVKSVPTVIHEILEQAQKLGAGDKDRRRDVTIRCNPDVARQLKSPTSPYLQELEDCFKANIIVRSDSTLHRANYDIN